MRMRVFMAALGLAAALPAWAIVNTADAIVDPESEGASRRLALSLSGMEGNTKRQTVNAAFAWIEASDPDFLYASVRIAEGQSRGQTDLRRRFAHLRYRKTLDERWAPEAFAQVERDPFARLAERWLMGGGLRWTAAASANARAYLGLGMFYEAERYAPGQGPTRAHAWRLNLYAVARTQFGHDAQADFVGFVQPALRDPADVRVLAIASLRTKATETLDLRLSATEKWDAKPPPGVLRSDLSYTAALE
ncbi:MAG: DUF481 domain-containing protein, partial [Zetaproteobacteria bacterium]